MFQFAHPYILYALILVPVMVLVFILSRIQRKKVLNQYGDSALVANLMPMYSDARPILKFIIFVVAFALFTVGLAGPQFGTKLQEAKRKGVEVIIALDVSNSMMAEDIRPNRLERAKQAISKLVDRLKDDKIGLIVFAGDAMTQLPITSDYISAKMFLSSISPSVVPVQGTAIGKAINLASVSFSPNSNSDKAIIVITDGENHEDDAIGAATAAMEKGIHVYAIGIGLPEGAPIPKSNVGGQVTYWQDANGGVVISRLDENLLNQIVAAGEGVYIRASNSQIGLNTIFDQIKKLKKGEYKAKVYAEYKDQFQWPIGLALLLLLFEVLVLERKTKLSARLNLFQVKN